MALVATGTFSKRPPLDQVSNQILYDVSEVKGMKAIVEESYDSAEKVPAGRPFEHPALVSEPHRTVLPLFPSRIEPFSNSQLST
jgi:hypothetical protein